jgi:hypothetical protein
LKKKNKKSFIINDSESYSIITYLFESNNFNLILLWYFCFYLGLSIFESGNLIYKNYKPKAKKIIFWRDKKTISRNIKINFCNTIEYIIKKYNLTINDFIIYRNKEKILFSERINIIKYDVFSFINNLNEINFKTKEALTNLFLTERESIKMTNIEKNLFENFNLEFIDLCEFHLNEKLISNELFKEKPDFLDNFINEKESFENTFFF